MPERPTSAPRRLFPTTALVTIGFLATLLASGLGPVASGTTVATGSFTLSSHPFTLAPPAGAKGPDDLAQLGISYNHLWTPLLWVAYQNGINTNGSPGSPGGPYQSTIAGYVLSNGSLAREVNVTGKVDGLTGDPVNHLLIATVNEDTNSSLYAINPQNLSWTHFTYSRNLSVGGAGGSDSIAIWHGAIVISHSNPSVATQSTAFEVRLNWATDVAEIHTIFLDDSVAHWGSPAGPIAPMALTDPDSNFVMPAKSPLYAGDLMTVSQADGKVIFTGASAFHRYSLTAVNLTDNVSGNLPPIDGFAVATADRGTLYVVDNALGTITGYKTNGWAVGTVFVGEPSDNGNPLLGVLNLGTGAITPFTNHVVDPKSIWFVPDYR